MKAGRSLVVQAERPGSPGKPRRRAGFSLLIWDQKNLSGNVETRDIVEAAKAWVPQIKEEGADIVIALSHSGIDVEPGEMKENASFFVAGVEGIDAVFTGHRVWLHSGPVKRAIVDISQH